MKFLTLIFGNIFYLLLSIIIKQLLKIKGFKVGKNFFIKGYPLLTLKAKKTNIIIGDNVKILGDIDIRTRENGSIHIEDNVKIEENCRFVAAREGRINIKKGAVITTGAIINGGADVIIGENTIIGPRNGINANEHNYNLNLKINEQGFIHKPVYVGKDCWTGANVTIAKGVTIGDKSIIGANSFVNKDKFC